MAETYPVWKVARIVGVCEKTIKRWERKGQIPKAKRRGSSNARHWDREAVAIIVAFFVGK